MAIYRLTICHNLTALKAVWDSLPKDIRREVEPVKNLMKDALK